MSTKTTNEVRPARNASEELRARLPELPQAMLFCDELEALTRGEGNG